MAAPRTRARTFKAPTRPTSRVREPCSDDYFRRAVDHLRCVCPVPKGCSLTCARVDEVPGEHGSCDKLGRAFTISISRELSEYETEHVLLHEWAHMLSWRPHHPLSGDHGPDWGVWFALVWRSYYGTQ